MATKRSSESEFAVSPAKAAVPARRKTLTAAARTRKKLPAAKSVEAAVEAPAVVETVAVVEAVTVSEPAYEAVAALAYSYWQARGRQGGSADEDWARAEQELRSRTA